MDATGWGSRHFCLSPEMSSAPGPYIPHHYQRLMVALLGSEHGPRKVVLMKSARVGYTLALLNAICYGLARLRRHIVIYQPTDAAARKFSKGQIIPALQSCPETREMLDDIDYLERPSMEMLRLGTKWLRVLGGSKSSKYREYSTDWVLIDESDELQPDVSGQGDPIMLASRAMRNSAFKHLIVGGTPTEQESSLIWKEFTSAQVRLQYHASCPFCRALAPIRWDAIRWPGKDEGHSVDDAAERAQCRCNDCGRLWGPEKLPAALERGRWQVPAKTGLLELSEQPEPLAGCYAKTTPVGSFFFRPGGRQIKWPRSVAMHISALYSPWHPWSESVREWLAAQGNPDMLKTFSNLNLGLPYQDRERFVHYEELRLRREDLSTLPAEVARITAAVDVQQEHLSALVVGWTRDERAYIVERREFGGGTDKVSAEAWDGLRDWIESRPRWKCEDGWLPISFLGIDSGYRTEIVYAVRARLYGYRGLTVSILKGSGQKADPVARRGTQRTGHGFRPILIGDWQASRTVLAWLAKPEQVKLSSALADDVIRELCSMALVTRKIQGRRTLQIEQVRRKNEAFDCFKYCLGLIRISNATWDVSKKEKEQADAQAVDNAQGLRHPGKDVTLDAMAGDRAGDAADDEPPRRAPATIEERMMRDRRARRQPGRRARRVRRGRR